MKKTLIILALAALLAGCQAKPTTVTNTNMNANINGQSTSLQATYDKLGLEDLLNRYNGAIIKTNFGDITVKFYNNDTPLAVNNFLNLAQKGFYNGTKFHRVIADFMIQGGDPNSKDDDWTNDGMGGPGYKFKDEITTHKIVRGSLAMANSGPNTNGSQFFIVTIPATPWLDGSYTNFGYVTGGMDAVDKIRVVAVNEDDHPTKDVTINSIELIKID